MVRELDQLKLDRDEFYEIALSEIEPCQLCPCEIEPFTFAAPPIRHPEDEMICCLMPDGQNFIFFYNDSTRVEAMKLLAEHAADPLHPLSWYDVAQMTKLMREAAIEREWEKARSEADNQTKHGPSLDR
jgi:hypothetical protein